MCVIHSLFLFKKIDCFLVVLVFLPSMCLPDTYWVRLVIKFKV